MPTPPSPTRHLPARLHRRTVRLLRTPAPSHLPAHRTRGVLVAPAPAAVLVLVLVVLVLVDTVARRPCRRPGCLFVPHAPRHLRTQLRSPPRWHPRRLAVR